MSSPLPGTHYLFSSSTILTFKMETTVPKTNGSTKTTIKVSLPDLAKMIDHSLLHPTMTDAEVIAGLDLSKKFSVATACVKPYHIPLAVKHLAGTSVLVCPVIGFPHGNSTTQVKVFEATEAAKAGGKEIDMVINLGKALSGEWEYVEGEIGEVNAVVATHGAILKVIFENDCEPWPRAPPSPIH
jgi:deoxyribose-phosphate aldolase